ncbi:CD1845 family protein [Metamycoplasma equirhinis]|uniref:CD1845 family protein n=1 Tax=Metamycoplasma equirhinis TaxID=92402 RepID=UPI0040352ACA
MILGILSFLVVLGSLAAIIQKDATTLIQALVIAFLISPYGLPKIALWVTAYI